MTVHVELARTGDANDVAQALTANGFAADAVGDAGHVLVEALEDWTAARGLPFVSQVVGEGRLVLYPPGS